MLIRRGNKLAEIARRNRQEIIKAGLSRRDLFKMGLLTSAGYLVAWPIAAWAIGLAVEKLGPAVGTVGLFVVNLIFGLVLIHAIGIPVLAGVLGLPLWDAILGDLAFVPGDAIKAAIAAIVTVQLRRAYPAFALRS